MCEDFSYILPLAQSTFEYKHLLLFLPNLKASNGFAPLDPDSKFLRLQRISTKKPITYIILNGNKLETFPLRPGRSQRCLPLPLFSNVELEILTDVIRQVKEIGSIQIRKEDIKFYVFVCR